ncbi:hypothetical protein ABFA07_014354 [Porites harrisoni]
MPESRIGNWGKGIRVPSYLSKDVEERFVVKSQRTRICHIRDQESLFCQSYESARHGSMEHVQEPEIKQGSPAPDELEGLSEKISDKWKKLGRRLQFDQAQITEHDKSNDKLSEKAYNLLMAWKGRDASAATYRVLHKALSDVERSDLAQEFCCQ